MNKTCLVSAILLAVACPAHGAQLLDWAQYSANTTVYGISEPRRREIPPVLSLPSEEPKPVASPTPTRAPGQITLWHYRQIKEGMHISQVRAIMGSPGDCRRHSINESISMLCGWGEFYDAPESDRSWTLAVELDINTYRVVGEPYQTGLFD